MGPTGYCRCNDRSSVLRRSIRVRCCGYLGWLRCLLQRLRLRSNHSCMNEEINACNDAAGKGRRACTGLPRNRPRLKTNMHKARTLTSSFDIPRKSKCRKYARRHKSARRHQCFAAALRLPWQTKANKETCEPQSEKRLISKAKSKVQTLPRQTFKLIEMARVQARIHGFITFRVAGTTSALMR